MKSTTITLKIVWDDVTDDPQDDPSQWQWHPLLDLGAHETVEVITSTTKDDDETH